YDLHPDHPKLTLSGFADDTAVTSGSVEGARRIIELTKELMQKVGLEINPRKSVAIRVSGGDVEAGSIQLSDGEKIECIDKDGKIKYLGCSFTSELIFDSTIVGKITTDLEALMLSPLLKE